jgi:Spy/CpxP family protein refolding chaperone
MIARPINQFGGYMNIRNFLAVAALGALSVQAIAQAPPGGPRGPVDRPAMIQRLALDDASLNLTADQKSKIDKIVDGYVADQAKMRDGMAAGTPPSQEVMGAMRTAREKLNTDVGAVLNDAQRTTWQASMAARRPPGGPGGGAGGPPPAK